MWYIILPSISHIRNKAAVVRGNHNSDQPVGQWQVPDVSDQPVGQWEVPDVAHPLNKASTVKYSLNHTLNETL